jgi:hypothetical protein
LKGRWWWGAAFGGLRRAAEVVWKDNRTWNLTLRGMPAQAGVVVPATTTASLARILLETGLALTPARSIWNPAAWFAVFRYCDSFASQSGRLRLVPSASTWDPRLTAILAEELAVGVASYLAREYLDVIHLADVFPLIKGGDVTFRRAPKVVDDKKARPDFLALDRNNQRLFIEAKGAVGTEMRLMKPLASGKAQVCNVDSARYSPRERGGKPAADRLVIGTHFCVEGLNTRSETTSIILDPPSGRATFDPDHQNEDGVVRAAYGQLLNLADEATLAALLLDRARWPESFEPPIIDLGSRGQLQFQMRLLSDFPAGGALVLHESVWRQLTRHHEVNLLAALRPAIEEVATLRSNLEDDEPVILLNNGVGLLW